MGTHNPAAIRVKAITYANGYKSRHAFSKCQHCGRPIRKRLDVPDTWTHTGHRAMLRCDSERGHGMAETRAEPHPEAVTRDVA